MEWSIQLPSASNVVNEGITETALHLFKSKKRKPKKTKISKTPDM